MVRPQSNHPWTLTLRLRARASTSKIFRLSKVLHFSIRFNINSYRFRVQSGPKSSSSWNPKSIYSKFRTRRPSKIKCTNRRLRGSVWPWWILLFTTLLSCFLIILLITTLLRQKLTSNKAWAGKTFKTWNYSHLFPQFSAAMLNGICQYLGINSTTLSDLISHILSPN